MAPITLKGYLVLDKIKDGSIGTVWRARNGQNKEFALKQLSLAHASDPAKVRQFEKEATLTRKLSHPGILKVHEYVPLSPQPFFVMEYFESENLKFAAARLPERVHKREFHILMNVASALAAVHGEGIVHRDVKPENVLVSAKSAVRLIDFSLAQTRWDRLLQFGRRVEGTPLYMSPEQIRGEKADARSDLYSFGVLMYELLTKRPPFLADSQARLFDRHLRERPAPMNTYVKTIDPELDAFVQRLLAKRPESRFQTMSEVLHGLSAWIRRDTVTRLRQVVSAPLQYPAQAASTA
jgi:serine/threonine-protein kinase